MNIILLDKLEKRNIIESRFSELFHQYKIDSTLLGTSKLASDDTITNDTIRKYQKELQLKSDKLQEAEETIRIKNKIIENVNNQILELTIEHNIIKQEFDKLKIEHETLLNRWLTKVQKDVDKLNDSLDNSNGNV